MSDEYSSQIRRLDQRGRSLESEVSDLESEVSSLKSKVGYVEDLDYELRGIRGDISSVESDLSSVTDDLGSLDDDVRCHIKETSRDLKRLVARVQALEASSRIANGASEADFDTVEPLWRDLARTAALGREIRSELLSVQQRSAHSSGIRALKGAVRERDELRSEVVAAAAVLAATPPQAAEHRKAVLTFESARAHADNHHQRAVKLNGPAQQARAALDRDDALRETNASLLEESDKAQKELTALLRGCLAEAIRDRSLMPMWFVTVLGPVPPAERTQEWMDLATEVLAYRVTHQVTDAVVALGPETDDLPERWEWHDDLTERLKRW
ncbi:hypothetical protein [Streptomyces sp. NPDC056661]|uniref:hypothetical protein n=1 Tax=Streptomyces sp. NPDC056661 TaxID=3345898 RepID=UPI0036AB327A